ncbi:hypothetical protein ABAC460_14650 [Asticcacaulis sp. AC460]|uniref:beta-galactosidase GalB n=1 Tax=Asticcacaulis sp. AC460 TaxID=1282360 RepID=UPI0003C41080|nr:beta-galactosidase GalB [Asticcacaulis sp. AC460]ESQ89015.1 hypothetical protein ABAC460_14650 [Asticcacaulis sp. AC460]
MPSPSRRAVIASLATASALSAALPSLAETKGGGRERLSINTGWRFHRDDDGAHSGLPYDIRPELSKSEDGKAADARPDDAAAIDRARQPTLKAWVLPAGNAFVKDPAKRHSRPATEPALPPFAEPGLDDSAWQAVTLPHDWAIAGPWLESGPYGGMGRLKSWGIGWYRRSLDIPARDRGKSVFLDIDGAMSYAVVWCNGHIVGGWPYGYNSWRLDLTPYLVPGGRNQIAIRLDNPPESARWYPGGGLYRNVWLTKANPVHVSQWGTFVTTPDVSADASTVNLTTTIDNDSATTATVEVSTRIFLMGEDGHPSGKALAAIAPARIQVAPGTSATVSGTTIVKNPRLWGPKPQQTPHRHIAITTVSHNGKTVDRYETPFGIRNLRFDPDTGLHVNGEPIRFRGVNNHHDLGALGAAFNVRAAERQLEIIQEMGGNAIRMSHNPPAPELLDLCDRMGFLVIDEVFDSWKKKKTPLDFHLIFPEWHEQDLRAMLRRDRNHPSIVLWSVGNEVGEQYSGEEGAAVARNLVAITREEDTTRPTMTAMNYAKPDMPMPGAVDVVTVNYQGAGIRTAPGNFPGFRAAFPKKMILTTESASALSTRGAYLFPVPGAYTAAVRPGVGGDPKTRQVSAYELFAADFGTSADRAWAAEDQYPYVAGEFVWSGFDYLGEPTPYYDARSSYSGILDLAGFKKDRFYLYQSRWRPDMKFVHILPHWTWPDRVGEVTPVHAITAGDEAELFVNGKSQGRLKKRAYEYRLRWDYVTYELGEITVVAYKNGQEWARATTRTAGPAAALEAVADRNRITGDGQDLAFITARITDKDGLTAPRADNRIRFTIDGPGEIVATDNGDPASFEPFHSSSRAAYFGLCLAIVRAKPGATSPITVRAEADGLTTATTTVTTSRL